MNEPTTSGTTAAGPTTSGPSAGAAGAAAPRRRGRPPGPPSGETRDRILTAAREEFSARGYDKTSVRSIARAAGVDAALVHHYFGTKEQVFAAAVEAGFAPARALPEVFAEPGADDLGTRLARFFLGIWEDPATREPLLAVVRSALTNDTAAAVFRRMVSRTVMARVAGELDLPDPELRVQLAASQLVGLVMLRYVVRTEPMASADPETLVALVAPALRRYLTDPDVHL